MAANGFNFDLNDGLNREMPDVVRQLRSETITPLQEDGGVLPNQQLVLPNQQALLNLHLPAAAPDQAVNAAGVHPGEALRPGAHEQAVNAAAAEVRPGVHNQAVNAAAAVVRPDVHDQAINAAAVAADVRPGVHDQAVNAAAVAADVRPGEALHPGVHNQAVNAAAAAAEVRPGEGLWPGAHDQAVDVEVRPGEVENVILQPQEVMDDGPPINDNEIMTVAEDSCSRGTKRRQSGEPPLEERFNGEMLETAKQYMPSCSLLASPPSNEKALKITNPVLEAHFVSAESSTKNKQRAGTSSP